MNNSDPRKALTKLHAQFGLPAESKKQRALSLAQQQQKKIQKPVSELAGTGNHCEMDKQMQQSSNEELRSMVVHEESEKVDLEKCVYNLRQQLNEETHAKQTQQSSNEELRSILEDTMKRLSVAESNKVASTKLANELQNNIHTAERKQMGLQKDLDEVRKQCKVLKGESQCKTDLLQLFLVVFLIAGLVGSISWCARGTRPDLAFDQIYPSLHPLQNMQLGVYTDASFANLADGVLQILQFDGDAFEPELSVISIMKEVGTPEAQLMITPVGIEHMTSGGIDPKGMPGYEWQSKEVRQAYWATKKQPRTQRHKEENAYMAVKKGERRYMSVDILHMS